jgi:hypothetical protein
MPLMVRRVLLCDWLVCLPVELSFRAAGVRSVLGSALRPIP